MTACRFESHVIDAATGGAWSESLRNHVASCADCALALSVAPFMSELATMDEREHILPDPAVLWLKSRILQNRASVERASLPITQLQIAAYLIIAACWAALLTWKSAALQTWISHLPAHVVLGASGASASLPLTIVVALIALSSATVAVAMHTILAEE
jgi:hypothetical protein